MGVGIGVIVIAVVWGALILLLRKKQREQDLANTIALVAGDLASGRDPSGRLDDMLRLPDASRFVLSELLAEHGYDELAREVRPTN